MRISLTFAVDDNDANDNGTFQSKFIRFLFFSDVEHYKIDSILCDARTHARTQHKAGRHPQPLWKRRAARS